MTFDQALSIFGYEDCGGSYKNPTEPNCDSLEELIHCQLFGFCGCGDPEFELQNFLKTLKTIKEGECAPFELQIYLYILDKEGFTEHGTSVFGSWLNEKGEALFCLLDAWYSKEYLPYLEK